MKTTLIARKDLIEEMSAALASPRISRSHREAKPIRVHIPIPSPTSAGTPPRVHTRIRAWDALEAAEGRVFDCIVRGTLLLAAAGSLAWLAYATLRFFLAWQGLAAGLRLALT
ncbi:MAG: hypothetical protein JNL10_10195 [Verrucomicrobiales bacterium]|nr:hypothetical protein [Verrucomicrobiales bacterium]